ncbi:hypothetical protein QVD17_06716 [Tagetes erecta]|uniref:Uncharacterized protein n=1 Tax=Tagetes erecta TaxID=13708 RepID=A0AAD8PBH8_TARER|nr:hypothetical protein QVD17_06716 [Tagetes erecta]
MTLTSRFMAKTVPFQGLLDGAAFVAIFLIDTLPLLETCDANGSDFTAAWAVKNGVYFDLHLTVYTGSFNTSDA